MILLAKDVVKCQNKFSTLFGSARGLMFYGLICSFGLFAWPLNYWTSKSYCHGFWRSISILNFLLSWCGQGTKEIKPESEVSQPSCSLHQLAQVSKEHLDEFLSIHSWPPPRPPQPWVYWKPPSNDLVKINFNGAIFSEVKRSSIGVVVRDKNGLVLASLS